MNFARISKRLATVGVAGALASAGLVAAGTTTANAATVTSTYTCSIPSVYSGDFPLTVTGELPVPQYYAGAPVPANLVGMVTASAAIPADAVTLLGAAGVDNAASDDFAFALGNKKVPVPVAGAINTADTGTTWDALGSNLAFTTPVPGTYDVILPSAFTIMTKKGDANVAPLSCVVKEGTTPAALTSITLVKQTSKTIVTPTTIKVKKGKQAKIPVKVTQNAGTPVGKVVAKEGTKTLKTVTLKAGKATLVLPKLKVGKHAIKVLYLGNKSVKGSSDKVTIKVVK